MHPLVRIMQRYIEDYCNRHDASVCLEIMAPEHVVHIAGRHHRGRDEQYIPAASQAFANFTDLRLRVHELHTNGDRLVMRFSERGTHRDTGRMAAWGGIGLYDWNGQALTSNWVEQDYASRARQVGGRSPEHALDTAHPAPWSAAVEAPDATALAVGLAFVERGDLLAAPNVVVDDSWLHGPPTIPLTPERVVVNDAFAVGRRVAVHATLAEGSRELHVAAILSVEGASVTHVRAITDRLTLEH
jgi:hypothetical protein